MSVKGLVDSADEIVVGRIERVRQIGSGDVVYNGVKYPRSDYQADINVDETIKSAVPSPARYKFVLSFSTPSADQWGNVAEGRLEPNTYRIIFLSNTFVWLSIRKSLLSIYSRQSDSVRRELASAIG